MEKTNNVKYPDHICRFNDGFDCECYCKGREDERAEQAEKLRGLIKNNIPEEKGSELKCSPMHKTATEGGVKICHNCSHNGGYNQCRADFKSNLK